MKREIELSEIEDRLSILEAIANYSYDYDAKDANGFAELFTENVLCQYFLTSQSEPEIQLNSREEIRAWAKNRLEGREGELISRHHQSSTVFDILQSNHAEIRTMVLVTHHEYNQPHPVATLSGVYFGTWEKIDSGCKFAKRIPKADRFAT